MPETLYLHPSPETLYLHPSPFFNQRTKTSQRRKSTGERSLGHFSKGSEGFVRASGGLAIGSKVVPLFGGYLIGSENNINIYIYIYIYIYIRV